MPVPGRLRPVALLLVAGLATACGSTVQVHGSTVAGGTSGELGPAGAASSQPGAVPLVGSDATGVPGAVAPGGVSTGGTTASQYSGTTGTTGSVGLPPSVSAPGVTGTTVYVGVTHDSSADTVNQAAGVGAITHGDDLANYRAIVDDINKHGGVGGRKLALVVAPLSSASTQTLDQQWAAVCQTFTRDHKVFVADLAGSRASYWDCLKKAGVGLLDSGLPTVGAQTLATHPSFLELGSPTVDRLAAYTVPSLVEQHYFTPWNTVTGTAAAAGTVKVGIYTYNDSVFSTAVDRYLIPALKQLGYSPVVVRISQIGSTADISAQAAAVKSAQLQFAANGVTHVIPFEMNGGLSTFFLPNARSQGYYPRYGINTGTGFEALNEAGVADPQQFNGAVGFGWLPSVDLPAVRNPVNAPWSNANRRYCLGVMRQHGITFDSGNAEGIALNACADLYLLKTVLDKIPHDITLASFVRTAEALGTSYQPAGSVGIGFRAGRHDPADRAYHWRWFGDCSCFHYEGSARSVP
jgi:hypothetical protein